MTNLNDKNGFTLIEVLVTIAFLAIILTMFASVHFGEIDKVKRRADELTAINLAKDAYVAMSIGEYNINESILFDEFDLGSEFNKPQYGNHKKFFIQFVKSSPSYIEVRYDSKDGTLLEKLMLTELQN